MPYSTTSMRTTLLTLLMLFSALASLAQTITNHIVVDQFGYLPVSRKIAVIRDPVIGFDASEAFSPGVTYSLVNTDNNEVVFTGNPEAWNAGATDASSGDKAWWFDFSSVTSPGSYYVLDVDKNLRSFEFEISNEVYDNVLKHAVRAFFYQRAGFEKKAQYAGAAWADEASHIGPLQDKEARPYNDKTNASKAIDVSGGWYDAGDYNKYTNWTASYVVEFMKAYLEAPSVWSDDYNIPESGNGVPDLLDEAKWGIDHLLRMQKGDGSVLSIVGLSHASPPSSATGPSFYGEVSTSATLNTAAALAIASKVFAGRGEKAYADLLKTRAVKAWEWAEANPAVIFKNNDEASGTAGLGAGQQETDDYGRFIAKIKAAVFLFEITGDNVYKEFVDNNYQQVHLMEWGYAYPFEASNQEALLYYTQIPGATSIVSEDIKSTYRNAMNTGVDNFPSFFNKADPYMAHLQVYTWGSNGIKALQGSMYTNLLTYNIVSENNDDALTAAGGYIHYIHGVNPLNMVYLSNMYDHGAENTVNEFYHTWFADGSVKWDRVGESTYGPPPGFLTGGPNPSYDWDGCCPDGCGGSSDLCNSESLVPPKGQPSQKSYKDFNTSWPINSWSVTENSNGYQVNYIRLLSKFITTYYDCSGTRDGTANFDICNNCTGGNTGMAPIVDIEECPLVTAVKPIHESSIKVFPNPAQNLVNINNENGTPFSFAFTHATGITLYSGETSIGNHTLNIEHLPDGIYILRIHNKEDTHTFKIVKKQ